MKICINNKKTGKAIYFKSPLSNDGFIDSEDNYLTLVTFVYCDTLHQSIKEVSDDINIFNNF